MRKGKIDVAHVAQLAGLKLTPKEIKKFQNQLGKVLDYISQLNKLKTAGVEPTSQVTGLENVFRKDEPSSSLSQEEVLQNTPNQHNGFFKVKAIKEIWNLLI